MNMNGVSISGWDTDGVLGYTTGVWQNKYFVVDIEAIHSANFERVQQSFVTVNTKANMFNKTNKTGAKTERNGRVPRKR